MIAWMAGMVLKATLLLVGVGFLAHVARRSPAATRHFVWTSGLALLVALPVLALTVPGWSPQWVTRWAPDYLVAYGPSAGQERSLRALIAPAGARPAEQGLVIENGEPDGEAVDRTAEPGAVADGPAETRASAAAAARDARSVAGWVLVTWIAGALLVAAWLAVGFARRARLRRDATPVGSGVLVEATREAARTLGLHRPVRLVLGKKRFVPMTWGVIRPVLYLPAAALEWTPQRMRAVLLHELAHIKRHDSLSRLIAQLACSVFWFHPLAWASAGRMLREQERACDDDVILAGADPHGYAETLLQIAREFRSPRLRVVGALALFTRRSDLEHRLLSILDPLERRRKMSTFRKALVAALLFAVVLPLAALRPASAAQQSDGQRSVVIPRVRFGPFDSVMPRIRLEPFRVALPRVHLEPFKAVMPRVRLEPLEAALPHVRFDPLPAVEEAQIGGSYRLTVVQEEGRIRLEATGAQRIPSNVDDIELEPDGNLTITGGDRRLEVRPAAEGGLSFRYTVDGTEQPFDDDARAWANGVLERIGEIGNLRGDLSVSLGGGGARVTRIGPGDLELSLLEPLELPEIELQVALDTLEAALEPLELSMQRMQEPLDLAITLEHLDATVGELDTELGRMTLSLQGIETTLEPLELSLQGIETALEPMEPSLQGIETALEPLELSLELIEPALRFDRVESWSENGSRFVAMRRGSIEIGSTVDDLDIGEDGDLVIDERAADGTHRRLYVYAGTDGEPVFEWYVDDEEAPFDDARRAWLQSVLERLR